MISNETKLFPVRNLGISQSEEAIPANILAIGAKDKWEISFSGKGIVVAILDTGCDPNHFDLKERIIDGYNFTEDNRGDIKIFNDQNGHGTHVAGIVAASKNSKGIVGVAPEAKLLILKVLDHSGRGSIQPLIEGIQYAIDWRGPAGEKVRIISLSLGVKNKNDQLHEVIKKAVKNNISVVAATGNDGDGNIETNEYRYPAAYEEVISVGAIDELSQIAFFTNTNDNVDLYAPGTDIKSTYLKGDYATLSGTSMAAPHVTGALALIIEQYELLTSRELSEIEIYALLMKHTSSLISNSNKYLSLNLGLDQSLKERKREMEQKNIDLLMKCFCEARKSQSFYTKCLEEHSTDEERIILLDLIENSAKAAKKIKEFCKTDT